MKFIKFKIKKEEAPSRIGFRKGLGCEQLLSGSLRTEREKRGVKNATAFVGFLALVPDLGREVVPATELFAVLPHLREEGNGAPVHEACDTLDVGLVARFVGDVLEFRAGGYLLLHEVCPAGRVTDDTTAVIILVLLDDLFSAIGVLEREGQDVFRASRVGALSNFLGLVSGTLPRRGLLPLLVTAMRIRLIVLHDGVGVLAGFGREYDVVKLRLHGFLRLLRQSDHVLGGFADVFTSKRFVGLHMLPPFQDSVFHESLVAGITKPISVTPSLYQNIKYLQVCQEQARVQEIQKGLLIGKFLRAIKTRSFQSRPAALSSLRSSGRLTRCIWFAPRLGAHPNFSSFFVFFYDKLNNEEYKKVSETSDTPNVKEQCLHTHLAGKHNMICLCI